MATSIDAGRGYTVVHHDAVTVNGRVFRQLEIEKDSRVALLFPDGKAVMGEDGARPYRYESVQEALDDAKVLARIHARPEPDAVKRLLLEERDGCHGESERRAVAEFVLDAMDGNWGGDLTADAAADYLATAATELATRIRVLAAQEE